jgi:hypothetical protein
MSMDPRQAIHEARQRENDQVALERDAAARKEAGRRAPGYVHFSDLVYVPGELLPQEVAEALGVGQADDDGVYRVQPPKDRRAPEKERT